MNSVCEICKISEVKTKCPVDEMGKNSVRPSTIERIIAWIKSTVIIISIGWFLMQ